MTRARYAGVVALVLLGLSGVSHAQDGSVDQARKYFQAGAQAYAVGQYMAAVQAFEQAYALAPRPAVLFSIAQAERRQFFADRNPEHLARAIDLFRRYVAEVPQGGRFTDAVQALSELEPLSMQVRRGSEEPAPGAEPGRADVQTRLMITSAAPDARIRLDSGAPRPSPFIDVVAPGRHRVTVQSRGFFDEQRDVVAIRGELVAVDLPLKERPGRLLIVAPDGAQLSIDGRIQGIAPFEQALELPAGQHRVTLVKSGFLGVTDEVLIRRGETAVVRARMPRSAQRTASFVTFGASLSTLVAAGVFAWFSRDRDMAASDFLEQRGASRLGPEDLQQYESARVDRDRLRTAAWVSVGASVGLAVTGGLLYAMDTPAVDASAGARPDSGKKPAARRETAAPAVRFTPVASEGFVGLGIDGNL